MKRVRLLLLINFLFLTGTALARQYPLDEGDVSSLVKLARTHGTVTDKRLALLIKKHGIDFEPSEDYLEGLQKGGAKEGLLQALRSAKRENQPGRDVRSIGSIYSVGGETGLLAPIYIPRPPYSESARLARRHGVVVLWVVISPGGDVVDIKEVSESLGGGLDEAAIRTVSTWKFKPPTRSAVPVVVHTEVEVSFRTF